MKNLAICLLLLSVAFVACESDNGSQTTQQPTETKPQATVEVPAFNADSAYAYVAQQVAFGPRAPQTPGHDTTLAWLKTKLEGWADKVYLQSDFAEIYNGRKVKFTNVIASFNPESKKRVLLCAHWDTRPYADQDADPSQWREPILGANDGASGVGVLLEVARVLSQNRDFFMGIDIVLFDLEDYGQPAFDNNILKNDTYALGSQYWSKNPHVPGYSATYGILLDMVGAKGSTFLMEGYSMQFAKAVNEKVWREAANLGFSNYFVYMPGPPIQDDHYYINRIAGIPTIDIIHLLPPGGAQTFHDSWHTHDDDMDIIDPKVLNAVGTTVLNVLYKEDAGVL